MRITAEDLAWWQSFSSDLNWRFATTLEQFPHAYVVRGKMVGEEDFDRAVRVIRTFGEPGKFYNRTNVYLTLGPMKWWTMGDELADTIIINQAPAEQAYGIQDAPRTASKRWSVYDEIATDYDILRRAPEGQARRDRFMRSLIREHFAGLVPNVLDVGCGTGYLLDLNCISHRLYFGIDSSQAMLNEFVRKHPRVPGYSIFAGTAREGLPNFREGAQFDLTAALGGSGAYLSPDDWERMVDLSKDLTLISIYAEGQLPSWYEGEEREQEMARQKWVRARMDEFAQVHSAHRQGMGAQELIIVSKA